MPSAPLVQLALDFPTIDEAIAAAQVGLQAGVDILEVGTPLLLAQGASAIARIAQSFPRMPILADFKTMDSGFKNVLLTRKQGGHFMTVCANAADETIKSAIAEGKATGIQIIVDTVGVKDQVARAALCAEWGVDMIFLHFGTDQRRAHPTGDAVPWVAPVIQAVGSTPVGIGCFGIEDAVRGVRAGASVVAIGHPIFAEPDLLGALSRFVDAVKASR